MCLAKYKELNPETPATKEKHVLVDVVLSHIYYDKGAFVPANRKLTELIQIKPPCV
jgi:hypothetical protein